MFHSLHIFGLTIQLYDFFNFNAWTAIFIYQLCLSGQKKELMSPISQKYYLRDGSVDRKRLIWCLILEAIVLAHIQLQPGVQFNKLWGLLLTDRADNFFGFALWEPVVFVLFCALVRIAPLKQSDMYAPAYALALVFFKIACFFAGCCYGVQSDNSFYYNINNHRHEVPIAMIEGIVALVIFVALHLYNKRKHPDGTTAPLFLILYSATRFVTEFWRGDFPAIAGSLTTYHFQCIAGVVIGVVELVLVIKVAPKVGWLNKGFEYRKKQSQERTE